MSKIQKVSMVLRSLWFVAFILTLTGFLIFLLYSLTSHEEYHMLYLTLPANMQIGNKLLAIVPISIAVIFGIFVTYFTYKLFFYFSKGELFTNNIVNTLKKIGYICLIGDVLCLLSTGIIYYIFPELSSQTNVKLRLDIESTLYIVIPLMVIVFSWVIEEGQRRLETGTGTL